MTGLEVLAVVAGVHALIAVAKVVVKKTKSPKDDKVVEFVAKYEDELVDFLTKKLADKKAPRPPVVDHRK